MSEHYGLPPDISSFTLLRCSYHLVIPFNSLKKVLHLVPVTFGSVNIDDLVLNIGFFFFKFIYFTYLFLAALGLCCCMQAFSSCGEWGLLFIAVRGLLVAVASLVAEHEL